MPVAERAHLSIGEVLSLLKEEFPDITISKIRFLESQGLLDPERTPSGYRKFYEDDVTRLRWILRQQREHFLPLKVIKGRLAGGTVPGDDAPAAEPSEPSEPSGPVTAVDGFDRPARGGVLRAGRHADAQAAQPPVPPPGGRDARRPGPPRPGPARRHAPAGAARLPGGQLTHRELITADELRAAVERLAAELSDA